MHYYRLLVQITDQSIFNVVTCLCFCHEWELNQALLWDYKNAIRYSIVGQLAELNHQTTLNYKLEKLICFMPWSSGMIQVLSFLSSSYFLLTPPILPISLLFQAGPHGSEFLQNSQSSDTCTQHSKETGCLGGDPADTLGVITSQY